MENLYDRPLSPINFTEDGQPKCRVCGCKSTGIHYGVVACEGCKAFYKRGLTKSVDYKCYFGGNCVVGPATGGRCKSCRFQKCVQAGMTLQGTKMGRIPKRKAVNGNGATFNAKSGNFGPPYRPLPSAKKFNRDSAVIFRADNCGNWTTHASVIQRVPYTHQDSPGQVLPYTRPQAHSFSSSNGDSEVETLEESFPQFQTNSFKFEAPFLSRRDSQGIARFSPDTLWSLRGFYVDSSSLDSHAPWVPSNLIPSLTNGLSRETISGMPQFLGQYWRVLKEKKLYVDGSVRALEEAVSTIYGHDFLQYDALLRDAVEHGLVPHQPQCSLEQMLDISRESMVDMLTKQCRFLTALRGFSELSAADQRAVIMERWLENWIVLFHPYYKNKELYYLLGPDMGIHFCTYWGSQLFADDYTARCLELTYEFKCLRLTRTEAFLFLAVAAFNPDTTTAKDKTTLSFLHAHYLDCLLQSVRSRQDLTDRTNTVDNLLRFMSRSRIMYRIGNLYVRKMDWSTVPVRAYLHGVPVTLADILAVEDDGLHGLMAVTSH